MPRLRGKLLLTMVVGGEQFSVRATDHAIEQMENRGISVFEVTETIVALGVERLLHLHQRGKDVCVANKKLFISVVFGWYKNRIMIVTVLSKSECVFAKNGTWLENINSNLDHADRKDARIAIPA